VGFARALGTVLTVEGLVLLALAIAKAEKETRDIALVLLPVSTALITAGFKLMLR